MTKHNPPHPGEYIREILHDSDMTATELAAALGMGRDNLYRLTKGRIALTPRTAVALERIGWNTAELWLRWQAWFDVAQIRREMGVPAPDDESDDAPVADGVHHERTARSEPVADSR